MSNVWKFFIFSLTASQNDPSSTQCMIIITSIFIVWRIIIIKFIHLTRAFIIIIIIMKLTHTHISLNKRYLWQFFLLLLLQMSCHAVMKWIHNELNEQCNGFGCVFMGIEEIFTLSYLLDSLWRNYKDQIGAFAGWDQNFLKKFKTWTFIKCHTL